MVDDAGVRAVDDIGAGELNAGPEPASPGLADQHRWAELAGQITDAQQAYYGHDAPTLSDADYDELMRELQRLEDSLAESIELTMPPAS